MRQEKNAKTIEESFLYQPFTASQEFSSETNFADYFGERQKINAGKAAEKTSLKWLKESAARVRFRLGGGRREII